MSKKKTRTQQKQKKTTSSDPYGPWIPMRTGLIVVSVLSVGMAAFTIWQTYDVLPVMDSIRYGLVRGVSIWVIFGIAYTFNRFVRGRGTS